MHSVALCFIIIYHQHNHAFSNFLLILTFQNVKMQWNLIIIGLCQAASLLFIFQWSKMLWMFRMCDWNSGEQTTTEKFVSKMQFSSNTFSIQYIWYIIRFARSAKHSSYAKLWNKMDLLMKRPFIVSVCPLRWIMWGNDVLHLLVGWLAWCYLSQLTNCTPNMFIVCSLFIMSFRHFSSVAFSIFSMIYKKKVQTVHCFIACV